MTSRRSFLSSLAVLTPLIFLPKFEPVVWKVIKPPGFELDDGGIQSGLTRCSIAHLTPEELEALFRPSGITDMEAWFRTSFETRTCEGRIEGMYDWLMESRRNAGLEVAERLEAIERPIIRLGESIGELVDNSLIERAI